MRVLDLGCHDGFVTNWIGRQFIANGDPIHVDGIELHPDGVRIAAERAARDGLAGEYKIGLAEDAPDFFEPFSYDAVVCFELIEHVPDVDRLLTACETMLKPGGRIYLSTPDGTFGAGNNPHHLRVYRAIDLAELLRRRGNIESLLPGRDGVVVAAYTPGRVGKLGEVSIYCGPGWQDWTPFDIETKGLGGSETAAVRLAEELSNLGYVVTVYGQTNEGVVRQVAYRHFTTFDPTEPREAVIVSRLPELFDRPINSPVRILWMHDTDYGPRLNPERVGKATSVAVLSRWHQAHVKRSYPFIADEKLLVTRNGITPDYFAEDPPDERPQRVIFSSSPDRGLDLILEAWPDVYERFPESEFCYCYSDVYDAVAQQNPVIRDFRDRIKELADQPGVRSLGALSQPALARAMQHSRVWVAPSYATPAQMPFHETYCIGAVEAAAAGCFRVGAEWGALKERKLEHYVHADHEGKPHRGELVDGICKGLARTEFPQAKWAMGTTWAKVAKDFHKTIRSALVPG